MDHSETSTNSSAPEPQMGQMKSSGSSSHVIAKTQLLQAYFFMRAPPYPRQLPHRPVKVSWQVSTWQPEQRSPSSMGTGI